MSQILILTSRRDSADLKKILQLVNQISTNHGTYTKTLESAFP